MRIIEIVDRSEQGITRPFLCRGEDGELYYVKGDFAGYRALCCEWVASELARRWGLPVAPFAIVEVPKVLIRGSLRDDIEDLGAGPAFGSQLEPNASELRWNEVDEGDIDDVLRSRLLLFDWWVANPDRILSQTGGNPNLLWVAPESRLVVIDHNLAFSPDQLPPSLIDFALSHVFGESLLPQEASFLSGETSDIPPISKATNELEEFWNDNRMMLDEIWSDLPEEWTDASPGFTLDEVRALLDKVEGPDFWGIPESERGEN